MQAASGDVDPFVELALYDPATNSTDVLWSSHMVNEPNPKWGEKFDFTMISATSRLTITVWDKLNFFEGRFSLKGLTGETLRLCTPSSSRPLRATRDMVAALPADCRAVSASWCAWPARVSHMHQTSALMRS